MKLGDLNASVGEMNTRFGQVQGADWPIEDSRRKATFFERKLTKMQKHPRSATNKTADLSSPGGHGPTPAAFEANSRRRRRFWIDFPVGFAVLVLSIIAGEQIKIGLQLPVPGNLLGLFVLLLCFRLRLIAPQLIEEAANRLLYVLPALFIPIFVSAIGQEQLWSNMRWVLFPTLLAATAGLWIFVGHLAQHLLHRSFQDE
jgi:holin-like protein